MRMTNELRNHLHAKIMRDLPSKKYIPLIHDMIQKIIVKHMPKQLRVVYDSPDLRRYLMQQYVDVRLGNKSVPMYSNDDHARVYGVTHKLLVRMDDVETVARLPEGSLYKEIVTTLAASGLVEAYFEQEDLRSNVSKRLKTNLEAARSIKALYDVLEPELHHYIPKDEVKATLPSCVAPVVDDLRKLGAVLPEVKKAEPAKA